MSWFIIPRNFRGWPLVYLLRNVAKNILVDGIGRLFGRTVGELAEMLVGGTAVFVVARLFRLDVREHPARLQPD